MRNTNQRSDEEIPEINNGAAQDHQLMWFPRHLWRYLHGAI
jgi:hypothetical protein